MKNTHKVLLILAIAFVLYCLIPLLTAALSVIAIVLLVSWSINLYRTNFKEDKRPSR